MIRSTHRHIHVYAWTTVPITVYRIVVKYGRVSVYITMPYTDAHRRALPLPADGVAIRHASTIVMSHIKAISNA